jgi:hypothetical protein
MTVTAGCVLALFPATSPASALVEFADDRLTVSARDVTLEDLLAQVAERANVRVTFERPPTETVTTAFSGLPVDEALRRLLRGHSFVLVYEAGQRVSELRVVGPNGGSAATATVRGPPGQPAAHGGDPSARPPDVPVGRVTPVRELVKSVLQDEEATVRARSTAALAAAGGAEAVAALRKALEDDAGVVRVHAVGALSRVERRAAIPVLSRVLAGDPDPQVRLAAARALSSMPTPDARAALEGAATDANADVRHEVRRALARLDGASR